MGTDRLGRSNQKALKKKKGRGGGGKKDDHISTPSTGETRRWEISRRIQVRVISAKVMCPKSGECDKVAQKLQLEKSFFFREERERRREELLLHTRNSLAPPLMLGIWRIQCWKSVAPWCNVYTQFIDTVIFILQCSRYFYYFTKEILFS